MRHFIGFKGRNNNSSSSSVYRLLLSTRIVLRRLPQAHLSEMLNLVHSHHPHPRSDSFHWSSGNEQFVSGSPADSVNCLSLRGAVDLLHLIIYCGTAQRDLLCHETKYLITLLTNSIALQLEPVEWQQHFSVLLGRALKRWLICLLNYLCPSIIWCSVLYWSYHRPMPLIIIVSFLCGSI